MTHCSVPSPRTSPYAGPAISVTGYCNDNHVNGYHPEDMEVAILLSQNKVMSGHQLRVRFNRGTRFKSRLTYLVNTGLLKRYEIVTVSGTRVPYLYGTGPVATDKYNLAPLAPASPDRILNYVIANQLYIRLRQLPDVLDKFVIDPADYLTARFSYKNSLFSLICLRDTKEQDEYLINAAKNIGPSEKRILVIGSSDDHVLRLAAMLSETNLSVRYTTDQNLVTIPLIGAFSTYQDGELVPVRAGLFGTENK